MTADTKPNQHPLDEGCFYCATDAELNRGLRLLAEGKPWDGRTLHMQSPASFCPNWTVEETQR